MESYADYIFYSQHYYGAMKETDFAQYAARASREIDLATHDRAALAPEHMHERIKLACCELADVLKTQTEQTLKTGGGAIQSENTDGYAVTYVTPGNDSQTSLRQRQCAEIQAVMRRWLAYPDNLIYPGVGV